MKVFILIDSSADLRFFQSKEVALKATEDEEFYMNERGPTEIEVVDDWAPEFGFDDKYWE